MRWPVARNPAPSTRMVLVTGPPRSGTTAVGDVLSCGPGWVSLHEPMNFHTGARRITRYFEVPGTSSLSEADFDELVEEIARCRLRLKSGTFPGEPKWRRALKRVVGGRTVVSQRRARLSPGRGGVVWKDPFATFAVDHLLHREDLRVVVCYRSARELAASFKRVGWAFSYADVQERIDPGLHVSAFGIDDPSTLSHAQRGALFWAQSYTYLLHQANRSDRVRFLDISRVVQDPEGSYRRLCDFCGIEYGQQVAKSIDRLYRSFPTGHRSPANSHKTHLRHRDPSVIGSYWSEVLTPDEIAFSARVGRELERRIAGSAVFL